jgi:hypothetical protein
MKKYRKKPVVIEAIQFDGTNQVAIANFVTGQFLKFVSDDCVIIKTLDGDMWCSKNDFVIRGVGGEFYPCKPDIFEATYEEVI